MATSFVLLRSPVALETLILKTCLEQEAEALGVERPFWGHLTGGFGTLGHHRLPTPVYSHIGGQSSQGWTSLLPERPEDPVLLHSSPSPVTLLSLSRLTPGPP